MRKREPTGETQDSRDQREVEAATQGRRAAWCPADSWARLIFTLEPEEKTNLTNGKKSHVQESSYLRGKLDKPPPPRGLLPAHFRFRIYVASNSVCLALHCLLVFFLPSHDLPPLWVLAS